MTTTIHRVAPDKGRNVQCTCGKEYSLASTLMLHIARTNRQDASHRKTQRKGAK